MYDVRIFLKQGYIDQQSFINCTSYQVTSFTKTTLLTYYLAYYAYIIFFCLPGRVAQSVTCLATDACLTADPGVAS